MTPDAMIREHLRKSPIKLSAWEIRQFFGNESNVSEEFLSCSLEDLADTAPEFEENHKGLIEDLEKNALLVVPLLRKIPIMTLLEILDQCTTSVESFDFFPDFPKPPATKLVDHIFPDETLSNEEKITEYEKIAASTPRVLEHLTAWRDEVQDYIDGLEVFTDKYTAELNEKQMARIKQLIRKSKMVIPKINEKIDQKILESDAEIQEFEKFYRIVGREAKYQAMDARVARAQIQLMFDESNRELRSIVAKMADSGEKEVKKEIVEPEEVDARRQRTQNGNSTGFRRIVTKRPTPIEENENGRRKSVRFES